MPFQDDERVDRYVKRCVEKYLRSRPETVSVQDVSSLRGRGRDEIEFIWQRRDRSIAKLDGVLGSDRVSVGMLCSEGDSRGELCLEVIADEGKDVPGWFHVDQDYLAYVSVPALELCFMELRPVRGWVLGKEQCFTKRLTMHKDDVGRHYRSVGLVVSARVLEKNLSQYIEIGRLPLL